MLGYVGEGSRAGRVEMFDFTEVSQQGLFGDFSDTFDGLDLERDLSSGLEPTRSLMALSRALISFPRILITRRMEQRISLPAF
jgi:hypothetical protein